MTRQWRSDSLLACNQLDQAILCRGSAVARKARDQIDQLQVGKFKQLARKPIWRSWRQEVAGKSRAGAASLNIPHKSLILKMERVKGIEPSSSAWKAGGRFPTRTNCLSAPFFPWPSQEQHLGRLIGQHVSKWLILLVGAPGLEPGTR